MTWRRLTITQLVVVAGVLIVYDVLAAWLGGDGSTISEVSFAAARARPVIVLALGVLLGHLFSQAWSGRVFFAQLAQANLLSLLFIGAMLGAACWGQPQT